MKTKAKILLSLFAMAVLASSCLGDKTQDDYIRDKVAREQANIELIKGVYRGTLTSKQSGATLGTLELEITSAMAAQNSNDNTTSQPKAVADGTLTFYGATSWQVPFEQAYYDNGKQYLDIRITLPDSNRIVELRGNFDGNTLSGSMTEVTVGGDPAAFSLTKDGAVSNSQGLSSGNSNGAWLYSETYIGQVDDNTIDADFRLQVNYKEEKSTEKFSSLLVAERLVDATVTITIANKPATYKFKDAVLNEAKNTLDGDMDIVTKDSKTIASTLHCDRIASGSSRAQWHCKMQGDGAVFEALVSGIPTPTLGKKE